MSLKIRKKFSYLVFLLLTIKITCGQSDIYFYEDFESDSIPSGFILIDVDQNVAGWDIFANSPYLVWAEHNESYMLCGHSYYEPPAQSDDWIITPPFEIGNNAEVIWTSKSVSYLSNLSDYEILVSNGSTDISDFTVVAQIEQEVNHELQLHSVSIADSGFQNQSIRLAIRNTSYDAELLKFDFIKVAESVSDDLSIETVDIPEFVEMNKNMAISAVFKNNGHTAITNFKYHWQVNEGNINTMLVDNINTSYMESDIIIHDIAFTPETSGEYHLKVWLTDPNNSTSLITDNDTINFTVYAIENSAPHFVLLEDVTATTCGPCHEFGEYFKELIINEGFENKVVEILYHWGWTGDPMYAFNETDADGRFKVMDAQYVPWIMIGGEHYTYPLTSVNIDILDKAYSKALSFEINADITFDEVSSFLSVNISVESLGKHNYGELSVYTVLTEDINYEEPPPGAVYDETNYNDVMRKMFPDYNGVSIGLPNQGEHHNLNFEYVVPDEVIMRNSSLVVFIQNAEDNTLQTGVRKNTYGIRSFPIIKTDIQIADYEQVKLFPNPVDNILCLQTPELMKSILIYNVYGELIKEEEVSSNTVTIDVLNLKSGVYFLAITNIDGKLKTQKFLKR